MRTTIKQAKEMHDLTVVVHLEILTRTQVMALYTVSWDFITESIKYNQMPVDRKSKDLKFSRTFLDEWFKARVTYPI